MTNTTSAIPSLSLQLKTDTAERHEAMHQLMEQGQPFASRENYVRFVTAQYLFQRDVECLFSDAAVKKAIPDLAARGRVSASQADLTDLGAEIPSEHPVSGIGMPAALGWLYVSEGSTLGAAFLLKEAKELGLSEDFGARNLAAYPEGRAIAWRRFVTYLDSLELDEQERGQVLDGAAAAFERFGKLLRRFFQLN